MSEARRDWGLRLLALGIAVGLWFSLSYEARETPAERLVEASLSYNRPAGYVVLDPVRSLNLRLRGSSKAIRRLSPFQVSVQVDLSQAREGVFNISLGPENILMPENLQLVAIEPSNVIRVELEKEITQRLPVSPHIVGEPAAGATLGQPQVVPDQVLVTGPASRLRKIINLMTRPIDLAPHALTFEETVPVISPDPLIQVEQPAQVTVHVPLQPPTVSIPPEVSKRRRGEG